MSIEEVEARSEEAAELLLQRAKRVVRYADEALARTKAAKEARERGDRSDSSFFRSRDPHISDMGTVLAALEDAIERFESGAPGPKRMDYVAEATDRFHDDEIRERHESFGQISFHRIQGHRRLYGSHLDNHPTFIRMAVKRSERVHSLSYDRYHEYGQVIVEVDMSAAQYAEAITTMNMGAAVPCTITTVTGIRYEEVPEDVEQEHAKIRMGFKKKLSGLVGILRKARKDGEEILEGKSVRKGDVKKMVAALRKLEQEVSANMPFVLTQFEESADRVVTAAKAEVESFALALLTKVGSEELARRLTPGILGDGPPLLVEGQEVAGEEPVE